MCVYVGASLQGRKQSNNLVIQFLIEFHSYSEDHR